MADRKIDKHFLDIILEITTSITNTTKWYEDVSLEIYIYF